MAVRPIVKLPHSVLRSPAEPVAAEDIPSPRIQRLIADMKDTLAASADGVGLAAPQIGVGLCIFLVSEEAKAIDRQDANASDAAKAANAWGHFVFINPLLKKRSRRKNAVAEGCLSVPGKFGEVARSDKVYLEWFDEHGKRHGRGFARFFARVIQHEMDHLDGILITDRAGRLLNAAPGAAEHRRRGTQHLSTIVDRC